MRDGGRGDGAKNSEKMAHWKIMLESKSNDKTWAKQQIQKRASKCFHATFGSEPTLLSVFFCESRM